MKQLGNMWGMALVLAGAILLIVSALVGWTQYNSVLIAGFVMVLLGVIVHVRLLKRRGKY